MKKVKQVIGIDVSKDTLAVCYGFVEENQTVHYQKPCIFNNDLKGFNKLFDWVEEVSDSRTILS